MKLPVNLNDTFLCIRHSCGRYLSCVRKNGIKKILIYDDHSISQQHHSLFIDCIGGCSPYNVNNAASEMAHD